MSLLDTPKPPPAPANARQVTSVTDEDRKATERVPQPPPGVLRQLRRRRTSEELHDRLTQVLQEKGTATAAALVKATGDHLVNVYTALRELRQLRRAHIARVGIPLVYAAGPSPAGEELDIAHLPGDEGRLVLLILSERPHTSRELGRKMAGGRHWQATRLLFDRGFLSREGEPQEYRYSLTEAGRSLAAYIAKLEEVYG